MSTENDPKKLVEQGYDQVAEKYANLERAGEWPRMRWLQKILDRLEPGSRVLDLGCGSGDPADIAVAKQHQITGVDISGAQIERARKNVPGGRFIQGDIGSLRLPPASFDAVVSFYTLEHLPRQEHRSILARIHDWLRPAGYLLISMEAAETAGVIGEWLNVPMYFSCFDPETLQRMVQQAGFVLLETAIEPQREGPSEVPYHWLLAQKALNTPGGNSDEQSI